MAKSKSVYICQNCGNSYPRWQGQCSNCGEWNTLVEEVVESGGAARDLSEKSLKSINIKKFTQTLSEVDATSASKSRFSTSIGEMDRVLGGPKGARGMVPGGVILIGGEPGIGKSTLLTQMVVGILQSNTNTKPIVYVSGEESPAQIFLRVRRILEEQRGGGEGGDGAKAKSAARSSGGSVDDMGGVAGGGEGSGAEGGKDEVDKARSASTPKSISDRFVFVTSTDVDEISAAIIKEKPQLVVVDSIQTVTTNELSGAAGSVGQVRETTERLTKIAKAHHIPTFLVGHVTKEGKISGPKVLEHIVDTVLELSGERTGELRLLRAIKNRFGATDEVGVFRVTGFGYESVDNPSKIFLEHAEKPVPGSATVSVLEGTRPLLIEVQALVVDSQLAMPRRVGRGVQLSRIQVLSAVLQKHARLPLGTADIFLSIAGGYEVREPAVDLGLAVAIASSLKNKPLPAATCFIGEVGLLGEIRSVPMFDRRAKEAKRLGFERVISRTTHQTVNSVLKELKLI